MRILALSSNGRTLKRSRSLFMATLMSPLIALLQPPVAAQTDTVSPSTLCGLGGECACRRDVIPFPLSDVKAASRGAALPISLEGDEVESIGDELVILTGNALLMQGRQSVAADQLKYFRDTDEVEGTGNVTLRTPTGDWFRTDEMKVQIPTQIGEAGQSEYRIAVRKRITSRTDSVEISARGTAEQVFLEGADVTRFFNVTYSTCAENNNDVVLGASELEIDQGTGRGMAKHLKVRFKNIPIFYFPRVSFPISDERKTGLLFPSFGTATDSGFVFGVPWYWNIRPNVDATIKPSIFTERGYQLAGEFRYKSRNSEGYFYGEYLPSDKKFEDEDRSMYTFEHSQRFNDNWRGSIDYNDVSDTFYFNDFRNDVDSFSATYVPRRADLRYSGRWFSLNTRAFVYQPVDDTLNEFNEPYERLPEFSFRARIPRGPAKLRFGLNSELVNYKQDLRVEGWRWDTTPSVRMPLKNSWGYFEPRLDLRLTQYSLSNQVPLEDQEVPDDSISRTVPVFSLNTGVTFERRGRWFGSDVIQTLEPRIFYAYVPKVDQANIPLFNTNRVSGNSFGDIFRSNRYFGADRVGDTNQVTFALSSRTSDVNSGDRLVRASIGQVFFLEDRNDINDQPTITDDKSDFFGEISASLGQYVSTYGFVQYDHDQSNVRQGKVDLSISAGYRKTLTVGYRFNRDSLEQITAHLQWPLTERWQIFGTERYAIDDDENLETTLGLEFDGCCWRFSIYGQRRVDPGEEQRNAIIAEFELTGLAKIRTGL